MNGYNPPIFDDGQIRPIGNEFVTFVRGVGYNYCIRVKRDGEVFVGVSMKPSIDVSDYRKHKLLFENFLPLVLEIAAKYGLIRLQFDDSWGEWMSLPGWQVKSFHNRKVLFEKI